MPRRARRARSSSTGRTGGGRSPPRTSSSPTTSRRSRPGELVVETVWPVGAAGRGLRVRGARAPRRRLRPVDGRGRAAARRGRASTRLRRRRRGHRPPDPARRGRGAARRIVGQPTLPREAGALAASARRPARSIHAVARYLRAPHRRPRRRARSSGLVMRSSSPSTGAAVREPVEPRLLLVDFLRHRSGSPGPTSAASTASAARARCGSTASPCALVPRLAVQADGAASRRSRGLPGRWR